MGEFGHAAMADGRRGALEGVRRPEDFVDHAAIEAVLQYQQALLDALDLLERLVGEQTVVAGLQIEGQAHVRRPLSRPRGA